MKKIIAEEMFYALQKARANHPAPVEIQEWLKTYAEHWEDLSEEDRHAFQKAAQEWNAIMGEFEVNNQ